MSGTCCLNAERTVLCLPTLPQLVSQYPRQARHNFIPIFVNLSIDSYTMMPTGLVTIRLNEGQCAHIPTIWCLVACLVVHCRWRGGGIC